MVQMGNFSRIRNSVQQPNAFTHIDVFDANGNLISQNDLTYPAPYAYDYIADTPHRLSHGTFGWKFPPGKVHHYTVRLDGISAIAGLDNLTSSGIYTRYTPPLFAPGSNDLLGTISPDISDVVFYQLTREAFNYFSDAFPEELSSSEFILGLRQLKDLIPQLGETIGKTFTGGYLNKKFGWDNLLSDLNVLSGVVDSCRERLLWFKRTYGKPTRLAFSRPNLDITVNPIGTTASMTVNGDTTGTYEIVDARIDFRAGCTLVQTLDHVDGVIGLIRALIGAFGLDNPVKAIWVNLPFSFVIDWFFRISEHLDSLVQAQPAAGWSVSNVTCSLKGHARVKTTYDFARSGYNSKHFEMGNIRLDSYRRFPELPLSLEDLLPTTELSPSQLVLMIALLHQQG